MDSNINLGRVLTRIFAVLAAAGLSLFMRVSSAGAWNVTSYEASVSAVHLDHLSVSDITVAPGATINIKLKYAIVANTNCPSCLEGFSSGSPTRILISALGAAARSPSAIRQFLSRGNFNETAPATAGSYFLAFGFDEDFGCTYSGPGWGEGTPNPQTQYFAHVTVT